MLSALAALPSVATLLAHTGGDSRRTFNLTTTGTDVSTSVTACFSWRTASSQTEEVQTVIIHPSTRDLALQVAHALEDSDTWCTGAGASNVAGREVDPLDTAAVKWCAVGHACRLGGPVASDLVRVYDEHFGTALSSDNDLHGREYVRDRLRELANQPLTEE
jgi:hypothetical protein